MIHADHVARPVFEPHRCSFTLRDQDPEGFFQGRNLTGPADVAYISVSRVRAYAQALGYVDQGNHELLIAHVNDVTAQRDRLEAEVASMRAKFDAIDVIESEGFRARKKAGRPPTVKEAA